MLVEYFLKVFSLLFIAIGPASNAAIFMGLAHQYSKEDILITARKACFFAGLIILSFAFGGSYFLGVIGVKLYSLQMGGGILLLVVAVQMVTQNYETAELFAKKHPGANKDLSIFPLATPLLAGPAAITQTMVLLAEAKGSVLHQSVIAMSIIVLMLIAYALFRIGGWFTRFLGGKGGEVLCRVVGILLAAIALQTIVNGIQTVGL